VAAVDVAPVAVADRAVLAADVDQVVLAENDVAVDLVATKKTQVSSSAS
jgi:hypothetical protein